MNQEKAGREKEKNGFEILGKEKKNAVDGRNRKTTERRKLKCQKLRRGEGGGQGRMKVKKVLLDKDQGNTVCAPCGR